MDKIDGTGILFLILMTMVYYLPLRVFAVFRMKLYQKVLLFSLLVFSFWMMQRIPDKLNVILYLLPAGLCITFFEKHHLRNYCCFAAAYLFNIAYNAVFLFVRDILPISTQEPDYGSEEMYIFYLYFARWLLIYLFFLWITAQTVSKAARRYISRRRSLNQPEKLLVNAVSLTICIVAYLAQLIAIGMGSEGVAYLPGIESFSGISYRFFLIVLLVLAVNYIWGYMNRLQMEKKQQMLEDLGQYTVQIEGMYASICSFKHDYVNIMTSMSGYLEKKDIQGLSDYFYKEVLPLGNQVLMNDFKLNELANIGIVELKSLVSSKLMYAHEMGAQIEVEVPCSVESISMERIDLIRIMGIFLDNAIEAALETEKPWIGFMMYQKGSDTSVIVSNTFSVKEGCRAYMDTSVSSKGAHRGVGLKNVSEILSHYPVVICEKEIREGHFIQNLEIHKGMRKSF
ncbi:MAG: GHKL domain-containing protein [Lachnospiraceae bacterium]|nr:GHKL domain-containing protein [Lachnospiraceae bacterium]